jgi:phosphotransferase system IIA component
VFGVIAGFALVHSGVDTIKLPGVGFVVPTEDVEVDAECCRKGV